MAVFFRDAVMQTLRDPRMRRVNFQYGPTRVYQSGYQRIARLVDHRHIRFELTSGHNAFPVDTPRGTPHIWQVSQRIARADSSGRIVVRGVLSPHTRKTIVHEATHALQDYQRLSTRRPAVGINKGIAEGAAYLAGWTALLLWAPRYPRLPASADPRTSREANFYARWLAERLVDGEIVYIIPQNHVSELSRRGAAGPGSEDRYVFGGI